MDPLEPKEPVDEDDLLTIGRRLRCQREPVATRYLRREDDDVEQELIAAAEDYAREGRRRILPPRVQSIVDATSRFFLEYRGQELLDVADGIVPGQRRRPRGSPAASAFEITSFSQLTAAAGGSARGGQRGSKRPRPSSTVTTASLDQGNTQTPGAATDASVSGATRAPGCPSVSSAGTSGQDDFQKSSLTESTEICYRGAPVSAKLK